MTRGVNRIFLTLAVSMLLYAAYSDLVRWNRSKGYALFASGDKKSALTVWSTPWLIPADRQKFAGNRGVAYYRLGEMERAAQEFRVASGDSYPEIRQHALYNLGTTSLQLGMASSNDPDAAARHFSSAVNHLSMLLEIHPGDADAMANRQTADRLLASLTAKHKKTARKEDDQQPLSANNEAEDKKSQRDKNRGESSSKPGKPGARSDGGAGGGERRTADAMDRNDAIRMLDEVRGREMIRSSVAAGSKTGRQDPPEKDW